VDGGLVVAPARGESTASSRIEVAAAGHPIPDDRGLRAARRILDLAGLLDENDLLIVLISGGASSLLPLPADGLTLRDKQETTTLLLRSGASIAEVNAVRKHLSAIKGGRLAQATRASVLTLILSDVGGDDLGTIGSGPTAPDPTTFQDAVRIIRQYRLWRRLPVRVRIHLVEGLAGWQEETPTRRHRFFSRVDHVIIGNNRIALDAAAGMARNLGYDVVMVDKFLTGRASETGVWMAHLGRALQGMNVRRPLLVIAGGEPTVKVQGKGRGGRAQEFALAAAMALQGTRRIWVAAMGTDGRDGPTDAAGAIVDGGTVAQAGRKGYDAADYLSRNDSYTFFKRAEGHIVTGLTGTNVNDLYMLLVNPKAK
jgi:glycerate-2-kinase